MDIRLNDLSSLAGPARLPWGVVVVDHGSRRAESNRQVHLVAEALANSSPGLIVEPAHMELASPSLAEAFDRCVARGARLVVVHPFFLGPGSHWEQDIPALAARAAAAHPGIPHLVTAPLGPHPALAAIVQERLSQCLAQASPGPDNGSHSGGSHCG